MTRRYGPVVSVSHLLERGREGDPPPLERRAHDRDRGVAPPPAHAGADHHVAPRRPAHGAGVHTPHDLREQLRQQARPPLLVGLVLLLLLGRRIRLRRDLRLPADGSTERGAGRRRQPGRAAPPGDHDGRRPGTPIPAPRPKRLARTDGGLKGGLGRTGAGKRSEREEGGTEREKMTKKRPRKLKKWLLDVHLSLA